MFNSIGPTELIIVLVIVLLIFGPKRLPGLGKQLGGGMREFKDSLTGKGGRDDDEDDDDRRADDDKDRREHDALPQPAASSTESSSRTDGEQAPLDGEVVSDRRS